MCFKLQHNSRNLVKKINCIRDSIFLIEGLHTGTNETSTSDFHNLSILPFHNTILLRGARTCCLMHNTMILKISMLQLIDIFPAIIRTNNFQSSRKLSLNHFMKNTKTIINITFVFNQILRMTNH